MADATTTTYSLTKPEVGASTDTWGAKLNTNLDSIDDLLDGTTVVTGIKMDDTLSLVDNADNTKVLQIQLSGITTGTTRTLTIPDASDTVALLAATQTFTNKTLTSPVLTTPQINDTTADHQYVVAVSELTADRTITLPLLTGDDEVVFKDHTQTLANKTLTTPVLTNATGSLNGATGSLGAVTLAGEVTGGDQTISAINLKDYGEITNALGDLGGGTDDIDLTLGNVVTATVSTATQTFTFSNPTASDEGCGFTLILTNGGSQTVNWPASVDWAGGTAPTLTAAGVDLLEFLTVDGGTTWHGAASSLDSK